MSKKFTELRFEEWVEKSLLRNGYHHSFTHSNEFESKYDKELCLVGEDVLEFIKTTQSKEYEKLYSQFDSSTDSHILKTIDKTITQRGIIDTLRGGIQTRGTSFELVYFKPKSSLNQDHQELYSKNRFVVVRQLHYSKQNRNSIDTVLFLNGIPIVTMELKNQLTGQNITNSETQYKTDRDPKETLLSFKRCLVHFCVDNDRVSMSTRLSGNKTKFLPYNKGITNPIVENDYRTEYLWNEVLTPDSLLDIIENFVVVSKETQKKWDNKKGMVVDKLSEVLIFPRYHQLHLLRKLKSSIVKEGVGHNYLIQHTTGSGKSYEIGWLSHLLTSLYQNSSDTKRMFDTILVITDRKVLDKQLQKTVSSLERTSGVVSSVELNSKQLQEFLEKGKDIIITTVQKFPFISETISKLKGHTFGVVIDEVHSSQSGETSKHLKKSLTEKEDETEQEIDYEEVIRKEIESRGKQNHISFFGFTGTPKNKTLQIFGRKNSEDNYVPFDSYTMKQSIYEGYTLDVLQNYTTYKRYFKVKQTDGEDKELPEGKVKREIVNFVDSNEKTIYKKVKIILDHFVSKTSKKIDGQGRGMVVVRSRKHCVLFHEEMVKQMKERNLSYSCLVGFSGSIYHNGIENTETSLNNSNGLKNTSIPNGLKDPRYRILIVSSKFQTGFDEPLLQSMYVDKKLSGVQCVQTLSRLNRTTKGKTDTFVLDFTNDSEDIVNSFQPYYTSTMVEGETDPDRLYDMVYEIEQYNLYTSYQVDEFCKVFYSKTETDERLHPIIDVVVDKYNNSLNEEQKQEFKSLIQSFMRLYSYISQISSFSEISWEKTYVFLRFLNKKLPKGITEKISIDDSVDIDSLRIQMIGTTRLNLEDKTGVLDPIGDGTGGMTEEEEKGLLSEIIEKINSVYGIELKEEDKFYLETVRDSIMKDEEFQKVMVSNNTEDDQRDFFKKLFKSEMIDYTSDRMDFYKKVTDPKVLPMLLDVIFNDVRKSL